MNARASSACALAALLALTALTADAQLTAPTPQPVVGARQPALSPDAKRLAFVYRGDVWVAPSEGGRATALTGWISRALMMSRSIDSSISSFVGSSGTFQSDVITLRAPAI